MSKNGGLNIGSPLPADYKPDIVFTVKYEKRRNLTNIENGMPQPLDALTVIQLCLNIAVANVQQLERIGSMQDLSKQPHPCVVLQGENKCRVPRCGKPVDDPIHNVQVPTEITAVQ